MPLKLPERASYEFLKKLAKERLAAIRSARPQAKLADAQRAVARDYGFASWRALKAEIDRRNEPRVASFMRACAAGDIEAMRELLSADPALARERLGAGMTGLHLAARHPQALQLLLESGADPHARDTADYATPLHFAASSGSLESVRILLDAGADVHGKGDLHESEVIGWASSPGNEEVIKLLLDRGAKHHIFSAMATRDRELVRQVVEADPASLHRRRSRFESGHTPLHAAFAPPDGVGFLAGEPDYRMLQLLIELGADVDAPDAKGRAPLALAKLRGDTEAVRLLRAAGATGPETGSDAHDDMDTRKKQMDALEQAGRFVQRSVPMFNVADMRATVRWYRSIGFVLADAYEDDGQLVFARLTFGKGEFTLSPGGTSGPRDVSLWFLTDRVQEVYAACRARQGGAASDSDGREPVITFEEDLYTPFYGGRQFSIRDLNGMPLIFWQPD